MYFLTIENNCLNITYTNWQYDNTILFSTTQLTFLVESGWLNHIYLEDVEVNGLDMGLGGNGAFPVGIPNDNVGVRADGYNTLSRIQVEDSGGVRAGDRNESHGVHYASVYTLLPDHWHSVLHTVHAIGNLCKIIFAQSLLFGIKRAIVATGNLKIISEKCSC